jgi:hypothetical protein
MKRTRTAFLLVIWGLALAGVPAARAADSSTGTIDPKAKEVMRQMSSFLAGLKQFRVRVDSIAEEILPGDLTLISDRSGEFRVQRPNRLQISVSSASRNLQFFFNGQTVSLYTPQQNYYGSWQAPATIDAMLDRAIARYGVSFPATDLIRQNPYSVMMKNVKSGTYVGHALIRGAYCHHLSFRQQDLDWEIWIEDSKTPYPRRLAIHDRAVEGTPTVAITLSGWNDAPDMTDEHFTFTPPPGATKIKVAQTQSQ